MAADYGFMTSITIFCMNVSGLVSLILNIILLPIILLCSRKSIGSYRFLLFLFTLISAAFSVVNYVSTPLFAVNEYGWVLYGASVTMSQEIGSWIIVAYCGCHSSMLLILTFCFLYRYGALCRPKLVQWFHHPGKVCVMLLISATYFMLWTGLSAICLRPTPETNQDLRDLIFEATGKQSEELSYIALSSYTQNGEPIPNFFIIVLMRMAMFYASAIIMAVCTIKVMKEIRSKAAATCTQSYTQRMQNRLFLLLLSQTLVPVLFSITPALLSYYMALFRFHAPAVSFYSSTLLPLSQIIDPLLTILLVSDYRKAPIRLYRRIKDGKMNTTVAPSSGTL